jgi:inosine/xanthosine triphosphatase
MEIIIGSKNPAKINAVKTVFPSYQVIAKDVESKVSVQPMSDEETRQGAINRARQCMQSAINVIGIGLEGGAMYVDNQLYLCNWGALVTANSDVYTASGARITLPKSFENELNSGTELGDLMDDYAKKKNVRQNEGAIGIFTNNLVSRQDMFVHVVKLLRGQWEFCQ